MAPAVRKTRPPHGEVSSVRSALFRTPVKPARSVAVWKSKRKTVSGSTWGQPGTPASVPMSSPTSKPMSWPESSVPASAPASRPASVVETHPVRVQVSPGPHSVSSADWRQAPVVQLPRRQPSDGHSASLPQPGGQNSGVSTVHRGSTHCPPRQLSRTGSPAGAGHATPAQSRVMTTVTTVNPGRASADTSRWRTSSPSRNNVTRTSC